MHIGLDISQTGSNKAGCGYVADSMAKILPNIIGAKDKITFYPFFGDFYFDRDPEIGKKYLKSNTNLARLNPIYYDRKSFWSKKDLEHLLGNPDVVHSNNYWCPIGLKNSRLVYTLYDLSFLIEPSWTTEANRIGCLEGVFRASIEADWIIAISDSTREDYLKLFPNFPPERISVINPASRFSGEEVGIFPKILGNGQKFKYWLCTGTIEPRKNQFFLAECFAQYLESGGTISTLIFAGGSGWLMDDFKEKIEALGIKKNIIFTGYVSDDELVWLYQNCHANLYPSFYEGFGLPVLEGMQFGAPTVASSTSSLPEITSNAAILLSPKDRPGWAEAMHQLERDLPLCAELASLGKLRANTFNWGCSARELLCIYKKVVSFPKRYLNKI